MDKRDYFLYALTRGAGKKRAWVNSIFSVIDQESKTQDIPNAWFWDDQQQVRQFYTNEGEVEAITTRRKSHQPLCDFRERFVLAPGEIANYHGDEPLVTTYGNVLVNHLLLVEPFGDLLPFQTGNVSIKAIEKEIIKRLIDDPEDDDGVSPPPDGNIYVRQYLRFCDVAMSLVAYASMVVTSVTPKALTGHPQARKRRKELMEEHKDRLNDPATIAHIGDELEKLDREWLKDDPTNDFYSVKDKKSFGKVRKKLFYLFGGESAFTDGSTMTLIERSLEEGIDPDKLPEMINSLRYGSYNRGAQTQLGGESTKTIYRMLGTVRIAEEDCGTQLGLPTQVTERNKSSLVGFWVIVDKVSILVEDNAQASRLVGNTVQLRTPATCKTEGRNVCQRCVGQDLAEQPDGLPAAAAGLGGKFLGLFLKKIHMGGEVSTTKWNRTERLT